MLKKSLIVSTLALAFVGTNFVVTASYADTTDNILNKLDKAERTISKTKTTVQNVKTAQTNAKANAKTKEQIKAEAKAQAKAEAKARANKQIDKLFK
ncbi:MAG: hypothetical protein MJ229_01120 [bacterium]|nr:hypothetical protein [bacterium]